MKMEITPFGQGTRFLDDDGNEIKAIQATHVDISVGVDQITTANVTLSCVSATVEFNKIIYHYAHYSDVVGLVLANGDTVVLPEIQEQKRIDADEKTG